MGKEEIGFEAVVDVGPLAVCVVDNPVRDEALDWLTEVLRGEIRCVVPFSSVMGAHIVATSYLGADPCEVAYRLGLLVGVGEVLWFSDLSLNRVRRAFSLVERYGVDSWDGYLLTVMEDFDIHKIYTFDLEDFGKISGVKALLPISRKSFQKFMKWVKNRAIT